MAPGFPRLLGTGHLVGTQSGRYTPGAEEVGAISASQAGGADLANWYFDPVPVSFGFEARQSVPTLSPVISA